ncbi:MAG: hypothetical protein A2577_08225 [Bdellovibrionales bacterium RIFOXYD1_FULL_36_51]|nr:MAG: hypothetical protein A2181_09295 [Bdellovibrionales bacterium RIFOXYA1_FULL_38_20]OFZ63736.1 MAG: hypothetical protein A2577_08225 [Bdellovibrionales bacterium RIFOXYD1_FULL_36_51]OFZ67744.1 MAG: hypothetical protein A2328_09600 [Bdellovibrionales bacterium RIFOXYB2_FULL_36_6]
MRTPPKITILKNMYGQSFIEFIFLFLTLIILSYIMLKATNNGIADRWVALVSIITSPDPDNKIKPVLK